MPALSPQEFARLNRLAHQDLRQVGQEVVAAARQANLETIAGYTPEGEFVGDSWPVIEDSQDAFLTPAGDLYIRCTPRWEDRRFRAARRLEGITLCDLVDDPREYIREVEIFINRHDLEL